MRQANGGEGLRRKLELVERGGQTECGGGALRVRIGSVEHDLPPLRRGGLIAVAHAQLRARVPDIVVQVAICIGRRRDGIEGNLRELRSGLVELIAALKQQAALRGKAPRRDRGQRLIARQDGLIKHGERPGLFAARGQDIGQSQRLLQRLRRPGRGALQHRILARHVAAGMTRQRALQARVDVTGHQAHSFELAGARFLPVLLLRMQEAKMVVQLRLVRRERNSVSQGVFGRIEFADLPRRDGQVVPVFGHVWLELHQLPQHRGRFAVAAQGMQRQPVSEQRGFVAVPRTCRQPLDERDDMRHVPRPESLRDFRRNLFSHENHCSACSKKRGHSPLFAFSYSDCNGYQKCTVTRPQ